MKMNRKMLDETIKKMVKKELLRESSRIDLGHGIEVFEQSGKIYFQMENAQGTINLVPIPSGKIQQVIEFLQQFTK